MVTTSLKRRHPRWRMFFVFVIFLGLFRHCELTPTRRLSDSRSPSSSSGLSGSPTTAKRFQDFGSLNDWIWQAWLVMDAPTEEHSGIGPKSVFVFPRTCAEGYEADETGKCVKVFNIDPESQLQFLVKVLNNIYANYSSNSQAAGVPSVSNNQKESNEPLHVKISLFPNSNSQLPQPDDEETKDSMNVPVAVPSESGIYMNKKHEDLVEREEDEEVDLEDRGEEEDGDEEDRDEEQATVTTYEVKNDTTLDEYETTFVPENTSDFVFEKNDQSASSELDTAVPVAEFIDDSNGTNFANVVDYEVSSDLKIFLNSTFIKKINESNFSDLPENRSQILNSTEHTPMLILLLSPTRLPNLTTPKPDDQQEDNTTVDHSFFQESTLPENVTDSEEDIDVSATESVRPSKLSDIPLID